MDHQNLIDRDFIELDGLNDRFPGIVHVGLGFHQKDRFLTSAHRCDQRIELGLTDAGV